MVNRIDYMDANGNVEDGRRPSQSGTLGFYNSFERKEIVNERTIVLAPGYYISPFMRAPYLLKRIFSYLAIHYLITFY